MFLRTGKKPVLLKHIADARWTIVYCLLIMEWRAYHSVITDFVIALLTKWGLWISQSVPSSPPGRDFAHFSKYEFQSGCGFRPIFERC